MFICLLCLINSSQVITFDQIIDHFQPSKEDNIFSQTIIIETKYSQVQYQTTIIYLNDFDKLNQDNPFPSAIIDLASQTSASLITIEPRFFGDSQPFKVLTTENLHYNTIEQNLADIAYFIQYLKENYNVEKVVVVGKGYGGTLATWFRLQYPQYVDAVWASSSPLKFISYDDQVDKNIAEKLQFQSQTCLDATTTLLSRFEAIMTYGDSDSQTLVKRYFGFNKDTNSNSVLYELAESFRLMAQTETNRSTKLLTEYCMGQKFEPNNETLKNAFKKALQQFGLTVDTFDPQKSVPETCDVKDARSLLYLKCNQIGGFHTYNQQHYFRSRSLNETYYNKLCNDAFQISKVANVDQLNLRYGNLENGASSVLLSQSTKNVEFELLHFKSNPEIDLIVETTDEESYGDELYSDGSNAQKITDFKSKVFETFKQWTDLSRKITCNLHGNMVINKCKCDKSWTGELCQTKTVAQNIIKMISAVSTLFPTLILLAFALLAWRKVAKDTKFSLRPSIF
ncbi:Clan SC, family S28, unassigned serine peptidase [Histomonas meleagridis]|uniref:Clan SC, family S28, unassigned serine peptidase n=1 Tax=Histomonas meleagridis TaxID=135588 RepID=UPI003559622F|nr:Clan SC, family S28, unassigned serine peptidase [Histomonas meleagridis]KAH0796883.1 Clan SC, family S28, unassigned serine peptidase [Histomonas meleagridis]